MTHGFAGWSFPTLAFRFLGEIVAIRVEWPGISYILQTLALYLYRVPSMCT
jgi:hypothetical protein